MDHQEKNGTVKIHTLGAEALAFINQEAARTGDPRITYTPLYPTARQLLQRLREPDASFKLPMAPAILGTPPEEYNLYADGSVTEPRKPLFITRSMRSVVPVAVSRSQPDHRSRASFIIHKDL